MRINEEAKEQRGPHILIVEDNDDDFEATVRALNLPQSGAVHVARYRDCEQAWQHLSELDAQNRPDGSSLPSLILLDLNMPGLDGRDLLARLKVHAWLKSIPVVVLTTSDDRSDVDSCYLGGANTYIRKPVNWSRFTELMDTLKVYWFESVELPNLR